MTAAASGDTLTTTNTTSDDVTPGIQTSPRQSWTCSSCHLSFGTGQMQREHMKTTWHIYNLKRRIASLPPIPLSVFEDRVETIAEEGQPTRHRHRHRYPNKSEEERQLSTYPGQCIFCPLIVSSHRENPWNIVDHMATIHGFFIPDPATLSDLSSFLKYLTTQVRVWHECLYCGTVRTSAMAIQDHMKDSGHCRLNFEKEPELTEFWEHGWVAASKVTSPSNYKGSGQLKLKLARGSMADSKMNCRARFATRRPRKVRQDLTSAPEPGRYQDTPSLPPCRQLTCTDELGILSLSRQQRHVLMVAVKRSQKDEAGAARAREWINGRKANDRKYDQAYGPLSWAKGGLHNLLPR